MVKISNKEYLICEDDIINNYNKLVSNINPKNLLFGFSNFDDNKIVPEYTIIKLDKLNENIYLVNDKTYRLNNKITKFDEILVSKLLNEFYGKPIKYHLIYEEDYGT